MHRSWNSVCLNHYIAILKIVLPKHHVESGTRTFKLSKQISGQSAHGTGLIKITLTPLTTGLKTLILLIIRLTFKDQRKHQY